MKAVNVMSNIAAFINESKRRKDIGKFGKLKLIFLAREWKRKENTKIWLLTLLFLNISISNFDDEFDAILVDKYRTEEEKTLTRRIAKLNMHSINKKSTRMSQRIFSSLGMEPTVNDEG